MLTDTQLYWLQWMQRHGGAARPSGLHIVAGDEKTNMGAAISFVHLVAKGAIAGKDGYLTITEYGRRLLDGRP